MTLELNKQYPGRSRLFSDEPIGDEEDEDDDADDDDDDDDESDDGEDRLWGDENTDEDKDSAANGSRDDHR